MPDGVVSLAADFPPADRAAWQALAREALAREALASEALASEALGAETPGGLFVQALYTAGDAVPPAPGRAEAGWDIRTLVDHPNPAEANVQALDDLENGATSLLLKLDPSGRDGVAATSEADLAAALDGVLLDAAPVALDAGWFGPTAADWLARIAKAAPNAPLAFHLDPLSAFAETGASPGPVESWLFAAALAARRHVGTYPLAGLFLASGRVIHEAGGSEAQELGFALSAALAYLKAADVHGLGPADALPRIVLGLSADAEPLLTIARLKAARAAWARMAAAFGLDAPARIEARSSRRMLTRHGARLNLARLTAAAFGAAAGGADAIVVDPFTRALCAPTAEARRLARNTQTMLAEESDLARVADPAAGAWAVENLADRIARAAWGFFQSMEGAGGAAEALRSGLVAEAVAGVRQARQADLASGKAAIVGVTAYADPGAPEPSPARIDPTPFAKPSPPARLPGPDSRCPPLTLWRAAETHESANG